MGASVPTAALYVLDREHDQPASYADWLAHSRPVVQAILESPSKARA